MNKKEFLEKLGEHLIVLESREQEDILDEYSQHIDMKIERGLSEEEAIRDFGSISELAAQILEAYHVNPEYEKATAEKVKPASDTADIPGTAKESDNRIRKFAEKVLILIHNGAVWCLNGGKWIIVHAASLLIRPYRWIRRKGKDIGARLKEREEQYAKQSNGLEGDLTEEVPAGLLSTPKQQRHTGQTLLRRRKRAEGTSLLAGFFHSLGTLFTRGYILLWNVLLWGIRWCWNGFLIFICLFSGLAALFSIFCFAMLVVWLVQGYPLTGVTILCLGGILCSVSFTIFCLSLLKFKHHRQSVSAEAVISEEVYHA